MISVIVLIIINLLCIIERCLSSIVSQKGVELEIIVSDDSSKNFPKQQLKIFSQQ